MSIEFFGNADSKQSPYPGWYFTNQVEDLAQEVDYLKKASGNLALDGETRAKAREEHRVKKAQLDNIVTHHRIEGDPVSEGFKTNLPFGQLKTYDDVAKKTWFDSVLSATNPFIGFAKRTKNTHGINNFYVS